MKNLHVLQGNYGFNIYITSDEEIEEGDWFYNIKRPDTPINRRFISTIIDENCKKIILTDHPTLVENGVQAIDDEFLEWFVKNPSCDFVMTIPDVRGLRDIFQPTGKDLYKIIIPKEEPKQETLEEASNNYSSNELSKLGFRNGAKWQQEQIGKSEFLQKLRGTLSDAEARRLIFEQFKNK